MNNPSPLVANRLLAKIVAISLLLVVASAFIDLIVEPIAGLFSEQLQRNQQLAATAVRYSHIIANEEKNHQTLARIEANPVPDMFYHAASDTSLGALLQADIRQLITQAGGRIDSMQSLQAGGEHATRKIGVSISIRTDIKTLTKIFQELKAASKLIKMDNTMIRAAEIQPDIGQPILTVRCDIFAYGKIEDMGGDL